MIIQILFLCIVALFFVYGTKIIDNKFASKRVIKYIPGIISFGFAVSNYILFTTSMGVIKVAEIGMVIMCLDGFISGMLTAIVLDVRYRRNKLLNQRESNTDK